LDGTLAEYHGWVGPGEIGKPIPAMVARVKQWIAEGREVRIFTARASVPRPPDVARERDVTLALIAIRAWCLEHVGRVLSVTCEKDLEMIELWDDRAVQVVPNTGQRADGRE
jgi:hypothetical protein